MCCTSAIKAPVAITTRGNKNPKFSFMEPFLNALSKMFALGTCQPDGVESTAVQELSLISSQLLFAVT